MPEDMHIFQFRCVTCRGDDHSEVVVRSLPVESSPGIVLSIDSGSLPDGRYIESIEEGIKMAWKEAGPKAMEVLLEVVSARDVSGESSPIGFREAARGAALKALGLPHLCPNPGVGVET